MKTIIIATIITAGICTSLRAESLSTTDGVTYDNITSKRVDPDGVYIEYGVPGGGVGAAKVKFARLSDDQRKQFNYDAGKAKEYEVASARALDDWRVQNDKYEAEARARRAAEAAEASQTESIETQRIIAMAQLKQAEADLARATGGAMANYGYGDGGWGGGAFAIPTTGRAPRARTDFAPIVTPVPFPQLNTPPQQHFQTPQQNFHGGNGHAGSH